MIAEFRQRFNQSFKPELYAELIRRLDRDARTKVAFRTAETPCFFPKELLDRMATAGAELTHMLVDDPAYMRESAAAVPEQYRMPNESVHPNFMTVDFGIVREADGTYAPRLVEMQAFPSIYGYQALLSQTYSEVFGLDPKLKWFLGGHDAASYWALMRQTIVGDHEVENVVLAEVEPLEQKTLPDFNVTEDRLGIPTVDIARLAKHGNRLFYEQDGREIPIHRIYNRAIVDEIERKRIVLPFDYRDDLQVEWAGHPNWYFRISKFSIPWLKHPAVPAAVFLDDWFDGKGRELLPEDRERWVFKPLYSFAGKGIQFAPSDVLLNSIPVEERRDYLLQERVSFAPVIETPAGATQAEVRVMYVWPDGGELQPLLTLVRMGRGLMMGVDHNRNQEWVGSSAAFFPDSAD